MSIRRSHYEMAFEAFLNRRGTPYVAVEDVRDLSRIGLGSKVFDYIVYPPAGTACLIDVKGRKSIAVGDNADGREKTWVTRADIEGLTTWRHVFGAGFEAAFVFSYWLANGGVLHHDARRSCGESLFAFAGRRYSFWYVPFSEYNQHQKQLSKSWKTVSVPRDAFRRISRPISSVWPAAPC